MLKVLTPLLALSDAKTTTATIAPIGSIITPSHFSVALTRSGGLTNESSGSTTVGPETIRIAPTRTAIGVGRPSSRMAPTAPSPQVIRTPIVISLRTAGRTSRGNWSNRRPRPPSKRISATTIRTNGDSESPSSSFGLMIPATDSPAMTPIASSGTITGILAQPPKRRATIERITTRAKPMSRACELTGFGL